MTEIIQDLTPSEVQEALEKLAQSIGPRAEVYGSIQRRSKYRTDCLPLSGSIYPHGTVREAGFYCESATWRGLVEALEAKWAEFSDEHARRLIRDMALEIIRITAEMGQCTDAALRADKFSPGDVARYGALAAEKANEMASNGPFSIVTIGGNGEHVEDEEAA